MRLTAIFISHLHGDHVFGLFPMISTLGLMGRKRPLHIYAPHPFGEILDYHTRYFDSELPYEVVWHEVDTRKHQLQTSVVRHSLHSVEHFYSVEDSLKIIDKYFGL